MKTNNSFQKYANNFYIVTIGKLTLYYSYETIIAFDYHQQLVITENIWSNTTGKHLNIVNPDKKIRIPYSEFKTKLDDVLTKINESL